MLRYASLVAGMVLIFGLGWVHGSGRLPGWLPLDSPGASNLPADLDYSGAEQVYDLLKKNFDGQLDVQKLLDGIKSGLAKASGDPYTEYLNREEAAKFDKELSGTFSGIGAELGKDQETDSVIVVSPIAGFPAEKAGLKARDIIAEIDGQNAYGISVTEAVNRIRGPKGTEVVLKVLRGGREEKTFKITRTDITIPSVEFEVLDGGIGLMEISRFGDDTAVLAAKAAEAFRQAQVVGVVVDVRGNPGGLLEQAVKTASLWLPGGATILTERHEGEVIQTYTSTGTSTLKGLPTAVLIDEGSASASEILAGALQDNGAAQLVGAKSFGKGSVQRIEDLYGGAALKVTIARWYTPDGRNIDQQGIEPTQKVEITEEDIKAGRDPQKEAALKLIRR